jgi:hypothetical protein
MIPRRSSNWIERRVWPTLIGSPKIRVSARSCGFKSRRRTINKIKSPTAGGYQPPGMPLCTSLCRAGDGQIHIATSRNFVKMGTRILGSRQFPFDR